MEELVARYGAVAMVGDGGNDAPAMARASLGLAMGAAGSDAAIETADIALLSDDVSRLPWLIRLSRRALSIIRQNIGSSLTLKLGVSVREEESPCDYSGSRGCEGIRSCRHWSWPPCRDR